MGVIKIANNNYIIDKSFEDAQNKIIAEIYGIINSNFFPEIKASAQDFLWAYESLKTAIQSQEILEERKGIAQKIRDAADNNIKSELKQIRDEFTKRSDYKAVQAEIKTKTQVLFQKLENFQKAIGMTREQQFKIFYVFPNDGNPIIVTAPLSELISWEYSALDKKFKGRFRLKDSTKFTQGLKKIEQAEELLRLNAHQSAIIRMYDRPDLDKVYTEVYERRQSEYIETYRKRTVKKKPQIVPVFLKRIQFYYINNLGDISQAYAQFYFSQIRFPAKSFELQIKFFIEKGVLPVNNQSGFLQQDIQFKIGEKIIQGAIKSLDAELMKYQDVVIFAKKIVQQGHVSIQDIESFIFTDAKKGIRNAFIGKANKSAIDLAISQIEGKTLKQLKRQPINVTIRL